VIKAAVGLALCGVALAPAASAWADDARPRTQPTRDVEVVYEMTRGDQQIQQRSRWQAATGRQRIDPPGAPGRYMIADPKSGSVAMVSDATRQVVDIKTPAGPLDGGAASFTRLGSLTIAGLACTEWAVVPAHVADATPNQICLRANDIQRARAVRVTYGATDPAAFAIPQDYQHVSPAPRPPTLPVP
jgi:hypothetical protein